MTKLEILALLSSVIVLSQLRSRRPDGPPQLGADRLAHQPVFGPRDTWPSYHGPYPLADALPRRRPVRHHRMLLRSCYVRRRR
ncbi:hypothetical protein [Paractinoplanes lichenicola]|uniref:Secreted protein n=1 Tax=Paractinoplanes lichenicola TaxID=2802976 RepID=A0ABS1VLP0_9ACTN|nr:hypothetical protein [Actinoplanes lichenicola]MBL7255029.1 hypothetical protein [Actinoplanes lichenicola]